MKPVLAKWRDLTPPTVAFTSPTNGQTVSGTITPTVSASDNYAVVGVQFWLDGSYLGDDTSAPFQAPGYDTHYLGNGGHTLQARARDAQGNYTDTSITFYVSNSAPGAGVLRWGNLMQWWDDADFTGWTSYRSSPPNYDNRWGGSLAEPLGAGSWWDTPGQGAGAYPALYLPGNPDPTHYQMRIQEQHGWVEGGTDHNHVYFAWWLYGNEYIIIVDGNSQGLVLNVNGGEGIQILRWANDPGWNTSMTHDIQVYYDFVVKPGYAS